MTDTTRSGAGGGEPGSTGSDPARAALDELVRNQGETNPAAPAADDPQGAHMSAQVTALEKERNELKDQLLRALAETENIRKRANKQIADEKAYAVERFARDLLSVSDYLAKASEASPPEGRTSLPDHVRTLLDGVELTQKELHAVLARHGVSAVDAAPGASFDPNTHQAVAQVPSEQPAGTVAQQYQSGWRIGERVLRAAMVAVSLGRKV